MSRSTASPPQEVSGATPPPNTHEKKPREQLRIRRRNRLITSCLECRRRKLKCDKQQPCTNCTRFSRQCVFIAPSLDPEAQAKLAEVKEKMGMLEKTLEDDVARRKTPKSMFQAPTLPGQDPAHSDEEEEEDARDLEFTDIATEHATYYEDEGNDDRVDLGIAMGKMRITERVGGLVRPRLSEELSEALKLIPDVDPSLNPYAGQSPESWMSPSNEFLAPSSSFYFAPGVEKTTTMTYLPSKYLVDKLLAHYWEAVHPIVCTIHRPSFERKYETFWRSIASGVEPSRSFQAVLFALLLQSIVSMPTERALAEFGAEKQGLVKNFTLGSESALARANFLRTTKLETLQATVMYLVTLCRSEVSRAHSALVGAVIRLAECMGLHRDPSTYSSNPVEIQVRRLIWYQICFLDMRTCEATGPRPQIRRDEYDTRFPLNIDDDELEQAAQRGDNSTLTGLLGRIQSFREAMEKAYLPMMSRDNPLHAVAMEMYGIMSSRLYLATLHPFASSDKRKMPERLRQIMISSCIMIVEHSMNIDQQPALSQWSWYVGALHQYHSAMLLLSELYVTRVDPALSARIWRCLDYAFELPSSLGETEKIRFLLGELVERTCSYTSLRRTEWDKLFGGAQVGPGNVVIPPFTFPTFEPNEFR
ncbi:fungal-specific transcription factor domain-containing protein [Bimuria novae-zelandiae CBS 107.79]|uniref:Fungal-specific transcription factor domain-containing protein n=1 Tax=Bimuria novae-zelandiae CBS 107.79 TaxID=1447943 RepID=A0A6A5VC27_9PLEO|nr:fungal-specific transcription factor domain-containing protein [Bimuria novae-zelandiae CBS 107.79]